MSRGYTKRRKEKRRMLDLDHPERVRIRRFIRQGKLPRYKVVIEKIRYMHGDQPTGNVGMKILGLQSVFHLLTKGEK